MRRRDFLKALGLTTATVAMGKEVSFPIPKEETLASIPKLRVTLPIDGQITFSNVGTFDLDGFVEVEAENDIMEYHSLESGMATRAPRRSSSHVRFDIRVQEKEFNKLRNHFMSFEPIELTIIKVSGMTPAYIKGAHVAEVGATIDNAGMILNMELVVDSDNIKVVA